MAFRVDQTQANTSIASAEERIAGEQRAPQAHAHPAVATLNPAWQRLNASGVAPAVGGALAAPPRVGAGLRAAAPTNKRIELAHANAQLQARSEIAERTLASIDPEHRAAVAAVFEHEIARYTAYCDSLT